MIRLSRREYRLLIVLGLLVWGYVLLRVFQVFYVGDELVTKWAYMVPWHFWPYTGYVDANNHFLLTFLGGLFIRLLDADAMALIRMPVALSFPLYAWSTLHLGRYFHARWSLYAFYIVLLCCPLFLEFFGLARGYGLSLALLLWGMWQARAYLENPRLRRLFISGLALTLAVTANLTLLPLVALGLLLLALHAWSQKPLWTLSLLPSGLVLPGLVFYSFDLRAIGKLYYGDQEGLVSTTLPSQADLVLGASSPVLNYGWLLAMIALLLASAFHFYQQGWKPDGRYLFPAFLAVSLINILGQHYLLGINFPEDRTALYLPLAFLGALVAVLDLWEASKWSLLAALGMVGVLGARGNFTHTDAYSYEHLDRKLVTQVPQRIDGLPPTTGGRFWSIANAMNRRLDERILAFQDAPTPTDTLYDYIIQLQELWPEEHPLYKPVFRDSISELTLYKRSPFLERRITDSTRKTFSGKDEYVSLWKQKASGPRIIRLTGSLAPLTIYSRVWVCVSVHQQEPGSNDYLECILVIANQHPNAQGRVSFDLSLAVPAAAADQVAKVYLWNPENQHFQGQLSVEAYLLSNPERPPSAPLD